MCSTIGSITSLVLVVAFQVALLAFAWLLLRRLPQTAGRARIVRLLDRILQAVMLPVAIVVAVLVVAEWLC
jgi:hypothetical protein